VNKSQTETIYFEEDNLRPAFVGTVSNGLLRLQVGTDMKPTHTTGRLGLYPTQLQVG